MQALIFMNLPFLMFMIVAMMFQLVRLETYDSVKMVVQLLSCGGILVLLAMSLGDIYKNWQFFSYFYVFVLMLIWLSIVTLVHSAVQSGSVLRLNLYVIYLYIVYFIVGCGVLSERSRALDLLAGGLWIVAAFLICQHVDWSNLRINMSLVRIDARAIHLYLGDMFAVVSLYLICSRDRFWQRYLLWVAAVVMVFIIGSRTSFYALVAVLPLTIVFGRDWKAFAGFALTLAVVGVLGMVFLGDDYLKSHRMLSFVFTGSDHNFAARGDYFVEGMRQLWSNWFWGDYAGQLHQGRGIGFYIHNYFSIWRQFGLIPFVLFLYMVGVSLRIIAEGIRTFNDGRFKLFVLLMAFCLIEVAFSRAYMFPFIFIPLGMGGRFLIEKYRDDSVSGGAVAADTLSDV